jgi:DNA-binding beta-propeller fold protein YncE
LVTTGNYQSGGPSKVVILDITNPYNVSELGVVQVASRGGAIAPVPGHALAVVSGTSLYNAGTQEIDGAMDVVDYSQPEIPVVRGKLARTGAFLFGLAAMPDGVTILVTDVGNPLSPSNRLLLFDITNPDSIVEKTPVSSLAFGGTGSPRLGISPDGRYAVAPNNVSNTAVVFDLADLHAPTAGDTIDVDALPFGVIFRPALP